MSVTVFLGVRVGLGVFVGVVVGVRVGVGVGVRVGVDVGRGVEVLGRRVGVIVTVGGTKSGARVLVGNAVPISVPIKTIAVGSGARMPAKVYNPLRSASNSPREPSAAIQRCSPVSSSRFEEPSRAHRSWKQSRCKRSKVGS